MSKQKSCTIIDEHGVRIRVGYVVDEEPGFEAEIGNPATTVLPSAYYEIKSVSVLFNSKEKENSLDVSQLSQSELNHIIELVKANEYD